jgi:prepilin signal peptidase PulO-like enzyme (type II secretory pathway)
MTPFAIVLAIAGLVLGVAADRLATRWPEHDEEFLPGRRIGWRTALCGAFGAFAFAVLGIHFETDPVALVVFGAWFATLVVGLATDLDQRLLPDVLTIPVIPLALIYDLTGRNPLVGTEIVPAILIAVGIPALLYVGSLPFEAGAFGIGDVKLLGGVGLMLGFIRTITGVASGAFAAGLVLAVLLVTRRISLKTYVPYGPFLIFGTVWAIFVRT